MKALKFLAACLLCWMVGGVQAQSMPNPPGTWGPFVDYRPPFNINNPSTWLPDRAVPTGNGISRTANATAIVDGVKIPMSAKWTATRRAVSIAGAAAAALCASTLIGSLACAAAAEYAIYKAIERCTRPSGWCTRDELNPPANGLQYANVVGVWRDMPAEACEDGRLFVFNAHKGDSRKTEIVVTITACTNAAVALQSNYKFNTTPTQETVTRPHQTRQATCPPGQIRQGGVCVPEPEPPLVESPPPYAHPGFIPWLDDQQGNSPRFGPNFGPDLAKDASEKGQPPVLTPPGPDVHAPPVTTTEPKTTTETKVKPDGSVDTVTRTTTTTVTPTVHNNQTTNTTITYHTTNVTTITTVNNVTNHTTTEVVRDEVPNRYPEYTPPELPNDYNKEATQKQVLDELIAERAPEMPDQAKVVKDAVDDGKSELDTLRTGAEALDKSPWFSWVWTPPSGSCAPFGGDVRGFAVSMDLCPTINNIRDVLGWLFAIFAAIQVYGQLFKGHE